MSFTERFVVASGGSTSGSALSLATAWTIEHAAANAVGDDRMNVEDGNYTLSANLTLPDGSAGSPIEWRGFHNTGGDEADIGNLENVGRGSATGKLTTTNFPVIDGGSSYVVTNGGHSSVRNLHIKSSAASLNLLTQGTYGTVWRCKLELLNTSTSCQSAYHGGSAKYGTISDCDCSTLGTGHPSVVVCSRGSVIGCRIWHDSGAKGAGNDCGIDAGEVGSTAVGNLIFTCSRGIAFQGTSAIIAHNTIYDVLYGLRIAGGASTAHHNIVYSCAYMFGGTSSGNVLAWGNAGGGISTSRIETANLGTTFHELNPVTLTADPFENVATEDFRLNTDGGGGALCRATSQLWGGFGDLGAVQHEDAGGGGTDYYNRGIQLGRWLEKAGR